MNVLIVDDEPPARLVLETMIARIAGVRVGASVSDGLEALEALAHGSYDLVLADISMPDLGGLELVDRLRAGASPHIIFVTAHAAHAVRAFELEAVDYLLKPVSPDRLATAIAKCGRARSVYDWPDLARLRSGSLAADHLWVQHAGGRRRVDLSEIEFISGEGDYIRVHTATSSYLADGSLAALAADLRRAGFLRVHRSRIVRLAAVRRVHTDSARQLVLTMNSGAAVRVGRRNTATVRAAAPIGRGNMP